jgi:assimilatory nitrate reductase electron transfer subunit
MTRVVVVGNGMVGSRFVDDLLAADHAGRFDITVLGAESCEPYNRVLLSEVVAGRYDLAALTLPTPDHHRLHILRGVAAELIDREDRVVVDAVGGRHRYDHLVLATGSSARIPLLRGLGQADTLPAGVHALRTIDDAREIVAGTLNARRAVVLGAGVLGLEAACGLARRGVAVTVVHPASAVMERQLDEAASRVVETAMGRIGIDHRIGVGADEVVVGSGGLRGVRLEDGELVDAQLLVLTAGTVANTALAVGSGLATERGILVGAGLESPTDRRVHAIGDCAQPAEGGSGLVAQGWEQARRLAARLAGNDDPPGGSSGHGAPDRTASTDVVRLKAEGLDVVAMGVSGVHRTADPAQRTLRLSDPALGRHVEVVVADGALVGATCVGAGSVAADLVAMYTRRTPLPADPAYLLLPALAGQSTAGAADPAALPPDAIVCRCNAVTKADITGCVEDGADSVEGVARATRATTGCGGCADEVCALVAWLRDSPPPDAGSENRFTQGKHRTNTAEIAAL